MQTVLCDICDRPVRGAAFEIHLIEGEATTMDAEQVRIVRRMGSQMMHLCGQCGNWVRSAMNQLRESYRDAAEVDSLLPEEYRRQA